MMKAMIDFTLKNKPRSRSLIIALLVLAILLPLWWQAGLWYRERLLNDMRARVTGMVAVHADLLSAAVNQRLSLLKGLEGLHGDAHRLRRRNRSDARFTAFASGLGKRSNRHPQCQRLSRRDDAFHLSRGRQ